VANLVSHLPGCFYIIKTKRSAFIGYGSTSAVEHFTGNTYISLYMDIFLHDELHSTADYIQKHNYQLVEVPVS
jgi:hypothetical protein